MSPGRVYKGAAVFVLLLASLVVAKGPAAAAFGDYCSSGSDGLRHAGWIGYARMPANWDETPMGVSAVVTTRWGFSCWGQPGAFNNGWVMIQDGGGFNPYPSGPAPCNGDCGYIQAGFFRNTSDTCNYHFWEWNPGGGRHEAYELGCVWDGEVHTYAVHTTYGFPPPYTERLTAAVDGVDRSTMWYDARQEHHWAFYPHISGEATNSASNMPGAIASRTVFSSLQIQSGQTGTFRTIPCYLARSGPAPSDWRYHTTGLSCTSVDVYTDPT